MAERLMSDAEIRRGLRELFRPRPMTVKEFAARCGLSRETVYAVHNGAPISDETRRALSGTLTDVQV